MSEVLELRKFEKKEGGEGLKGHEGLVGTGDGISRKRLMMVTW